MFITPELPKIFPLFPTLTLPEIRLLLVNTRLFSTITPPVIIPLFSAVAAVFSLRVSTPFISAFALFAKLPDTIKSLALTLPLFVISPFTFILSITLIVPELVNFPLANAKSF